MELLGLVLLVLAMGAWILIASVIRSKRRCLEDEEPHEELDYAQMNRKLTISKELAEVIGSEPLPRTEVVKKLWAYIRKNNLQDPKERRIINADEKLRVVFGGKERVSMFEMTTLVKAHLGELDPSDTR